MLHDTELGISIGCEAELATEHRPRQHADVPTGAIIFTINREADSPRELPLRVFLTFIFMPRLARDIWQTQDRLIYDAIRIDKGML